VLRLELFLLLFLLQFAAAVTVADPGAGGTGASACLAG
jgi:hypothetical protein